MMGAMSQAAEVVSHELTEHEAALLDFEDSWFTLTVPKDQAITERFGISVTRYYERLNSVIDNPAALDHNPLLVKRLRRLRSARQVARSARRLAR